MADGHLTLVELRRLLRYEPETGHFYWLAPRAHRCKVGDRAGTSFSRYYGVTVYSKRYLAHRLAWFYVHGEWPKGVVDHINGDGKDNRLSNLQDISQSGNLLRARISRANKSGVTGLRWVDARRKWAAEIKVLGRSMRIGEFQDKNEAEAALFGARRVALAIHGEELAWKSAITPESACTSVDPVL